MQDQSPAIRTIGLRKTYGSRHALDGLDLEVPPGYPYLSGRDNLRVLAGVGPAPASGRTDAVLELVGLRDRASATVIGHALLAVAVTGVAARRAEAA